MEGWIIDYQADKGPDYTFRNIIVIVDKDEDSAKKTFMQIYDYPYGNYLTYEFEKMVETVIEKDPDDYMKGEGWELSINSFDRYENVSSNEASYKDFYFATEDHRIKDVIVDMIDIIPSINDYIKDKIGISSHYKIKDFIESIDLDNNSIESSFLYVPEIPPVSILMTMLKRDIL